MKHDVFVALPLKRLFVCVEQKSESGGGNEYCAAMPRITRTPSPARSGSCCLRKGLDHFADTSLELIWSRREESGGGAI